MIFKKYIKQLRKRVVKGKKWLEKNNDKKRTKKYRRNKAKYFKLRDELVKYLLEFADNNPDVIKNITEHQLGDPSYIYWAKEQWYWKDRLINKVRIRAEENLLIFYNDGVLPYIPPHN